MLTLPVILFSQTLRFEQFGVQEGLPSSEVYNLFQDDKGYVWAFTQYGIVKHDGRKFIPVCRNLSFDELKVYVIRRSLQGNLYIGNSNARIYCIRNDSAFLVNGLKAVSKKITTDNEILFDMLVVDSSEIYLSTYKTSYRLFKNKRSLLTGKGPLTVRNIDFKKKGTDFMVIYKKPVPGNTVIRIMNEKDSVLYILPADTMPNWGVRSYLRESHGNYYILRWHGITHIGKNGSVHTTAFKDRLICMETGPGGHIWLGTDNGIYELDSNLRILTHHLKGHAISDVLFDMDNGMWVSSIGHGLFYCRNMFNVFYDDDDALSGNITLLKKIGHTLFIGTSSGSLFSKNSGATYKINLDQSGFSLNDIILFNNEYLIGTKGSILSMDTTLKRFVSKPYTYMNGEWINSYGFAQLNPDTLIFISGSAILKKDKKQGTIISPFFRARTYTRSLIIRSNDHACFVGAQNGLFLLADSLVCPPFLWPLRERKIVALKSGKGNTIWICTKGYGLYVLQPDNKLEKIADCPTNVINNISFTGDTTLLSTNKGLFMSISNNVRHALWSCIFNNEVFASEIYGEHIYIATSQGLVALNKKNVLQKIAPRFYLEAVTSGKEIKDPHHLDLTYQENDLYFDFDIPIYENQEYDLSYHLEGPDAGEGVIAGEQLHLQNLSPGHYLLQVRAVNNTGTHYSSPRIDIPFYIKPAFWQTRWFLVVVILSCLLSAGLVMGYSYRRLKRKGEAEARIIRQLAGYRLTALKAQINPHFISNSLAAIQQLVYSNEIDKANRYIAKFSLLIRYALEYSDKMVTSLANELKIIDITVELEQLRFSNHFIFEKQIDKEINPDDFFVPPLITQPLIENAIWHGLLPLKDRRVPKLILKISIDKDHLVISIIDNGVGRRIPDYNEEENRQGRDSRGTFLITSWIESLNKLFLTNSAAIQFIDLPEKPDAPGGTRVDISFKLEALTKLYNEH
ncbi:MAG: histidine kinase [Bacteroidota bacterium]